MKKRRCLEVWEEGRLLFHERVEGRHHRKGDIGTGWEGQGGEGGVV